MSAAAFREAIVAAGFQPPAVLIPDFIHRYPGRDKHGKNLAGWCLLFKDCTGGVYGDWSSDTRVIWRASEDGPLVPARLARKAYMRHINEAAAELERLRNIEQPEAARCAASIYETALQASASHPYAIAKGIALPVSVKQAGNALLVPIFDVRTNLLVGCQKITADGKKFFTKGMRLHGSSFIFSGVPDGPVAICEGFATAASIHAATRWHVVCAFCGNNLEKIAGLIREQHPSRKIVICADNDHRSPGGQNVGIRNGWHAVKAAAGILVAPPVFDGTDWNDYSQTYGEVATRDALLSAAGVVP